MFYTIMPEDVKQVSLD